MAKRKRNKSKKSQYRNWLITISILFFLTVLLYLRNDVYRYSYKAFRWYRHLTHPQVKRSGVIDYPWGYSVHGIDVSKWQDEIDWTHLQARTTGDDTLQFQFAFIKATEGLWLEDPLFEDNWKQAKKNKIIRGAYHYFLPRYNPKAQARNFISNVKLNRGDLPPVIDVEETGGKSKKEIVNQLKIYIKELEFHYKTKPIIYSNINFIENYLADDFKNYKFWVAHYYRDELIVEDNIKWLFWQHSDKAGMFGCEYLVDVNVFNGTRAQLQRILIQ